MIIYKVTNLVNGKIYVGKTARRFSYRKSEHLSDSKNKSDAFYFHSAIRKYGENNFKWEIIDRSMSPAILAELEKGYIKKFNCKIPNGYNLTDGGEGCCGFTHSEEAKLKISIAAKGNTRGIGNKRSSEGQARVTAAHKGKRLSLETKQKLAIAAKAQFDCQEKREKHRMACRARAERERKLNIKRTLSPEHKEKLFSARAKYKYTLEARMKMSEAHQRRHGVK